MTDWNEPSGGEATGHEAVGFITGQRLPDGEAPRKVRIEYRRDGETRQSSVLRETNAPRVEFDDDNTVRFWELPGANPLVVDAVLRAKPMEDDA